MKLSDLVAYRTLLDDYRPRDAEIRLAQIIDPVHHMVSTHEIVYPDLLSILNECRHTLSADLTRFDDTLKNIHQRIQEDINGLEHQYFSSSYRLYEEEMVNDSVSVILNRRFSLSEEAEQYLAGRIRAKADWKRPGMIIRPGLEKWVEDLVALDPLYLIDSDHDLMAPARERFNETYKQRLRCYVIKESNDEILASLPNDQMGFCLAYNFFNYKPFEVVRNYFEEIYEKLVPGGVLAFTINDCDRAGGVALAERNFMCYTPGGMIKNLARSIGYVVQESQEIDAATTWIELAKSGYRASLRGGQAVAQLNVKRFSAAHREELVMQANHLGLEVPDVIDTPALEALIEQTRENSRLMREEAERIVQEQIKKQARYRKQAEEQRLLDAETQRAEEERKRHHAEKIRLRMLEKQNTTQNQQEIKHDLNTTGMTSEQIIEFNELRKEAIRLKIDSTDAIMNNYTFKKLKQTIKQWRKNNA
jgi:SAM-dependent methyltransferase